VNDLTQRLTDVWADWETALFTMSLTSSAGISMPAFKPQEDILNIHCDKN